MQGGNNERATRRANREWRAFVMECLEAGTGGQIGGTDAGGQSATRSWRAWKARFQQCQW
jgi:hypothetical protein